MPRPVLVTYRVWPTPAELAAGAAELFALAAAAAVKARGVARIAVSGGTTPKGMFAALADRSQPYFAQVPWDKLHLFWVDERCVPPTDADSNYRMTSEAMLQHVPLPAAQVHRMEGELNPALAAARYEAALDKHHHLVCLACGEIINIPAPQVAAVAMAIAQDYRYSSVDAALVVSGRCARCAGLARNGIG